MSDFDFYALYKALHIISVIAWMAGMLYLPRLFVYHADADKGSELSETFKIMERKLLRIIINPAMVLTFVFGGLMLWENPEILKQGWMHAKITLVLGMTAFNGFLARWRKQFVKDQNTKSAKFYRGVNEIPTMLMIVIVILVVMKPF
jgi:putative membrane protein